MTVLWGILAVTVFTVSGFLAYLVLTAIAALNREPVWHPGDKMPDVPQDAPIRQVRG